MRGKACPLPIVAVAKAIRAAPLLELWATDPATRADLDAWCAVTGHRLEKAWVEAGVLKAWVARR